MSISRKDFLKQVGMLSVIGASTVALTSCGGDSEKPKKASAPKAKTKAKPAADCTDLSGIPDSELQKRTVFKYMNDTPEAGKHCENCALYIQPKDANSCGGCQLFAGPVTTNGHCTAWAAKVG